MPTPYPYDDERTQIDGRGDEYSALTALDCSVAGNVDVTRQEFKADADVNNILARYGAGASFGGPPPIYGETNYDADLREHLETIKHGNDLYKRLPPEDRAQFPTPEQFYKALDNGTLQAYLAEKAKAAPPTAPPTP